MSVGCLSKLQKWKEILAASDFQTFQDILIENDAKIRYVDKWEKARQDQNLYLSREKENFYLEIIKQANVKIEQEMRVNAEMENYISETQKVRLKKNAQKLKNYT